MITDVNGILTVINASGVLGLLVVSVWAFYNGKVMSSKIVDKILREADSRTSRLAGEIKSGIQQAVTAGIAAGIQQSVENGIAARTAAKEKRRA